MKKVKHTVLSAALLAAALTLCAAPASAQAVTMDSTALFCFSEEDFTTLASDDGIFITAVPSANIATVRYGARAIRAGDALPREALRDLTLDTSCVTRQEAVISYYTVSGGEITGAKELKLSILPQKNEPPTVQDSSFQTYKNIANSGNLNAQDPEGGALTFTLVKEPKRGTVEIHEDGSFTYTPKENKVGKDSFVFTATDEAGNTSAEAKVSIEILKPTDKAAYADMAGDEEEFEAMWMKDRGLYTGSTVGGNLCFGPDEAVTRGEFLVMVMKLVGAGASDAQMTSGFADEAETPGWMQPYIVSALGNGMISGVSTDSGVVFRPGADLTRAEAVVLLQKALQLPAAQSVFAGEETDGALPAWAEAAAGALSASGIEISATGAETVTHRDAAKILYAVQNYLDQAEIEAFYWAQ